MPCYEFKGAEPRVHPSAYIHPSAEVIGNVTIGRKCFIAPGATLRGDIGRIVVGDGSNIQDGCILHVNTGGSVVVKEDVTVGHGAVLHGCTVEPGAMVGMRAVVLDDAVVGSESIVAACAFVKMGMAVPPRTLVAGVPGRVLRELTDDDVAMIAEGTVHYQHMCEEFTRELQESGATG